MSNFTVESGKKLKLLTAGKYVKDDLIIEGVGGSSGDSGVDLMSYLTTATFVSDISEVTEDITLHLERATNLGNMFDIKTLNMENITVYISNRCTNMGRAFGRATNNKVKRIEIIGDMSKITNYNQMVQTQAMLEELVANLDFSSVTGVNYVTNVFYGCTALKEVRFVPNTLSVSISLGASPNLSADSIQSIINGLTDLTDGTAQTLTLHADVKTKLTEEQITTITNKNWTLA